MSVFHENKDQIREDMGNEEFAPLLSDIWIDAEYQYHMYQEWVEMFESVTDRRLLMDEDDLQLYDSLDEEVTVYRGVDKRFSTHPSLAWTTDIEVAKWFANRFDDIPGVVLQAKVLKKDIYATYVGRNESEVVVKCLKDKKVVA
jgi:hypothetical protein